MSIGQVEVVELRIDNLIYFSDIEPWTFPSDDFLKGKNSSPSPENQ